MRRLVVGMAIITLAGVALSWAVADDKEIAKQITERLKHEQELGNLSDFDINLKVAEGYVLLKGQVSSPEQQKLALEVARKAKGVKRVVSDLDVQQSLSGIETDGPADNPSETRKESDEGNAKIDDGAVAAAIAQSLRDLREDGNLKGFRINFDVTDGSVVMKGTVSSQTQRDLALETARKIRGVERMADQLLVKKSLAATRERQPETASGGDPEIAQHVCSKLRNRKEAGELKGFSIDLTVDNGAVILTGHVSNPEQRQLAEAIAKSTKGVDQVVNNLVVAEDWKKEKPVPETPEIATEEPQTLAINTKADPPAEQEVPTSSDSELTQEIALEFQRQRSLGNMQEFKIRVTVENGIAILDGRVNSVKQREAALDIARKTEGVRRAVDKLIVVEAQPQEDVDSGQQVAAATAVVETDEPKKAANDADIARRIASELKRQKQAGKLKGFRIDLNVEDGVATLTGRVSTEKQRQMVADAAKNTDGLRGVVNNLTILQQPSTNEQAETVTPAESTPASDSDAPAEKVAARSDKQKIGDRQIAQQIVAALSRQKKLGGLRGFSIDVAVENGIVRFDGHVSSAEQLALAMDIARHTDGVRDVVSHLAINEKTTANGTPTSQNAIAEAPRRPALLNAVSRLLRRDTTEQTATRLASFESSSSESSSSEPTSAEPSGAVENAIYRPDDAAETELSRSAHDQQIGQELMKRLRVAKQEGNLRGFGIGVRVIGGSVYLAGNVSSPKQQQLALDVARNVPHVREVVNELTITEAQLPESGSQAASMIAQELGQRLKTEEAQGNLADCDFDIKVSGSDVWLSGEVARPDQEQLAVETARRIPGVQRVVSALKIATVDATPPADPASEVAIPTRRTPVDAGPASALTASRQPIVDPLARMPVSPGAAGIERNVPLAGTPQAANASLVAMGLSPTAPVTPLAATAMRGFQAAPAVPLGPNAGPVATGQYAPTAAHVATTAPVYGMPRYVAYPAVQPASGYYAVANQTPRPLGAVGMAASAGAAALAAPLLAVGQVAGAMPPHLPSPGQNVVPARYDHPSLPGYAWPSYAAAPNYGAVTYPKQYSPTAWPYIGPFYPYPQVPLGWRRVELKWDDGWWQLNFKSK